MLALFNEVHQKSEASRNKPLHTRGEETGVGGWGGGESAIGIQTYVII